MDPGVWVLVFVFYMGQPETSGIVTNGGYNQQDGIHPGNLKDSVKYVL